MAAGPVLVCAATYSSAESWGPGNRILNVIIAKLAGCPDVVLWGIDLKGGMELQPWAAFSTVSPSRRTRQSRYSAMRSAG